MPNVIARTLTLDDISDSFFQAYDNAVPGQLVQTLSLVADQVSSGKARFPFADSVPKPLQRKRGDPLKINRLGAQEVEIVQARYENAVGIDLDDLDDDNDAGTGTLQRRISEIAEPFAELRYSLMIDVLLDNLTAYDGVALIGDHTVNGNAADNAVTASDIPTLAVVDKDAPTPEEFSTVVTDLIGHMYGYKDPKGHAINRSAKEFVVFVPVAMWGSSTTAVAANNLTSGQTAILNALNNGTGFSIDVQPEPLLTATDQVFVVRKANAGRGAFIATQRKPVAVSYLGEDSEHAFDHHEVKVKANWRGGAGPGEPRYLVRGTLSDA